MPEPKVDQNKTGQHSPYSASERARIAGGDILPLAEAERRGRPKKEAPKLKVVAEEVQSKGSERVKRLLARGKELSPSLSAAAQVAQARLQEKVAQITREESGDSDTEKIFQQGQEFVAEKRFSYLIDCEEFGRALEVVLDAKQKKLKNAKSLELNLLDEFSRYLIQNGETAGIANLEALKEKIAASEKEKSLVETTKTQKKEEEAKFFGRFKHWLDEGDLLMAQLEMEKAATSNPESLFLTGMRRRYDNAVIGDKSNPRKIAGAVISEPQSEDSGVKEFKLEFLPGLLERSLAQKDYGLILGYLEDAKKYEHPEYRNLLIKTYVGVAKLLENPDSTQSAKEKIMLTEIKSELEKKIAPEKKS